MASTKRMHGNFFPKSTEWTTHIILHIATWKSMQKIETFCKLNFVQCIVTFDNVYLINVIVRYLSDLLTNEINI